jgi:hypothetical protein
LWKIRLNFGNSAIIVLVHFLCSHQRKRTKRNGALPLGPSDYPALPVTGPGVQKLPAFATASAGQTVCPPNRPGSAMLGQGPMGYGQSYENPS